MIKMNKKNITINAAISVLLIALLSAFALAETQKILAIEFSLGSNDNVKLVDMRMYEGEASETAESLYSFVLLSETGDVLYTVNFIAAFEAWPEEVTQLQGFQGQGTGEIGPITRDEINIFLKVPYLKEASKFQIKHNGNVIFESLISLCNQDSACEPARGENFLSCEDCESGGTDDYCDELYDGKCDADCVLQGREIMDPDCTCGNAVCDAREDYYSCSQDCGKAPMNKFMKLIIYASLALVGIVVLIVLLIVLAVKKKKKSKR